MKSLNSRYLEFAPKFPEAQEEGEPDDILIQAIEKTLHISIEFARLAEATAILNSNEVAITLLKAFDQILEHYRTPRGFSGHYQETQFDFFKFIGHELFVIFISFLIRENRWELITNILDEGIFINNAPSGMPDSVSFEYISEYIESLRYRKQRLQLNRISIHADILNERHTSGKLGEICPMDQFIAADLFLFLRADSKWTPWSTLYLFEHFPKFIVEAKREKYAKQLLQPLGVKDIDTLRSLIADRRSQLHQYFRTGFWHSSLDDFDLTSIGSK
jgi:hypothetical protein